LNKIGVLDFETDPFVYGQVPYPFASCIYFGEQDYALRWEPQITKKTLQLLGELPKSTLYAHNGGRFDFHFLCEFAEKNKPIIIRNERIVQMDIGQCTLKDSWPLMPFALEEYKKTKIDYNIFDDRFRNIPRNRAKIEKYLIDDCKYLLELLLGFRAIVGEKDTIGAAAFHNMRLSRLNIISATESHDDMFRKFYYGGRVEAFQKGDFNGTFKYFDINSAYPFAMLSNHASGMDYYRGQKLPRGKQLQTAFVHCVADSTGALPMRNDEGGISFPHIRNAEFFATGWEIETGLKTGTLKICEILDVWIPRSFINFSEYVKKFYALRLDAKHTGDEIKKLAYKYLLNSGYGKFAQNPREFKTYQLAPYGENLADRKKFAGFEWEADFGAISLWSENSYKGRGFYDVATGASITGFVRAYLWEAICKARNVLYCDTDALICSGAKLHRGENLGEWKIEGIAERVLIAGKKLYAVKWKTPVDGEKYKITCKGARLTWRDMLDISRGKTVKWENAAPTFSINGPHFIERNIRST
jgi:hypothetical protein